MADNNFNDEKYAYLQDVFGMLLDNTLGKSSKNGNPLKGKYCTGIYEGIIPAQPFYNHFKKTYKPNPYFSHTVVAYFLTMAYREKQLNKAANLLRLLPSDEQVSKPSECQWNQDDFNAIESKNKLGACFASFVDGGKFMCPNGTKCIMRSIYARLQQIENLYPQKRIDVLDKTIFDAKKERQKFEVLSKELGSFDGKIDESLMKTCLNIVKLADLEDINLIKLKLHATRVIFYFSNISKVRYSGYEETCYDTLNDLLGAMRIYNFDSEYKDLYLEIFTDMISSYVTLQELDTNHKIGTYKRISNDCQSCVDRLTLSAEQKLKLYIEWWLLSVKNNDSQKAEELKKEIDVLINEDKYPELGSRYAFYKAITGIDALSTAFKTVSKYSEILRRENKYTDAQEILTDLIYYVDCKASQIIANSSVHLNGIKACDDNSQHHFTDITKCPRVFYDFFIEEFFALSNYVPYMKVNYCDKYSQVIK